MHGLPFDTARSEDVGPEPTRARVRARTPGGSRGRSLLVLGILAAVLLVAAGAPAGAPLPAAGSGTAVYPTATSIYVRVVRTGWNEAAVLGVQNGTGAGLSVSILVNGVATSSSSTIYNGEFWALHVPVANGSTVQAVIGSNTSGAVPVPAYAPQPVAPPGFIYAQGSQFMINGTPIQLFGVDEETGFTYAMIADGLCGWNNPSQYWGNNQLFPSGPNTKISGVSSVDQYWQDFFQYFLHYNQVAGNATNPKTNVIRITVIDDSFAPECAYYAWKNNPTAFWQILDSMFYWAGRAGLYVVPVLGHITQSGTSTNEAWYNLSSPQFARHVAVVQAILARYNTNPRVAMWDLWNEPDVNNDVYWASVGGIAGFVKWASTYLADVKPYSSNHLLTMGTCGWTLFPGVPSFGWEYYFFFNAIPGLEVGSNHYYASAQDQYLIGWPTAWHEALNIPEFEGEFDYNAAGGGSSLGYGYWPWFAQQAMASGWSLATMVYLSNGLGPYADYPYLGSLPAYPNGNTSGGSSGPVASFQVTPSTPTAGAAVTFDGSLSSDTVTITSYHWSFGDGGSASGMTVTHTYASAGTYPVALTVTDANGASNTSTRSVQVAATAPPPGAVPPTVTTQAATGTGPTSSTLHGNLGTLGSASTASVGFVYGTSPSLAGATNVTVESLTAAGPFSLAVDNLSPSTPYYVRAWANGAGFAAGSLVNFSTSSAAGPSAAPAVLGVTYTPESQELDISFSQPMDQGSVQGAISISPATSYQVVWVSSSHVQLRLTSALVANSDYALTVAPTARSASGQAMADSFTFRFAVLPASPGAPTQDLGFWTTWLPWIALALGAAWIIALALYLRGRRKYHALRQTTRVLARRIEELRALNARTTPKPTGRGESRASAAYRVPRAGSPAPANRTGKPLSGP